MTDNHLIKFSDGTNTLYGSWSIPDNTEDYPLVVLATGDSPKGSQGQTWQQLVPMLNAQGIGTFLFDFAPQIGTREASLEC